MVPYGRPSCSSWAELVWSSFGRTIMGKAIWENPFETWLGENSKLGMCLCTSRKRIILNCVCGWHKIGWKETKQWPNVESTYEKKSIWASQHHSLTMSVWVALKENAKLGKILKTITEICLNSGSPQEQKKSFLVQGDLMQTSLHGLVIWKVMQRDVWSDIASLRTKQPSNCPKSQLHAVMTIKSKKKKLGSVGELSKASSRRTVKIMLTNSLNACIWHALVDQTSYVLWTSLHVLSPNGPKPVTHALHIWSLTHHTSEFKQYCHVGNTAQQCRLGLFQDSDFAQRSWKLKIDLRTTFVHIWKSYIRTNKLDVQDKNLSHTVQQNLRLFLLMQVYAWMGFQLLIFRIWLLKCSILTQTNLRNRKEEYRETCCMTVHQTNPPTAKPRLQFSTIILRWAMSIMSRRSRSLLNRVRCSTFWKTTKQRSKWSSKAEVQQWDTHPEPTELRSIGYLTESTWTQTSKSNLLTPKTTISQTYWQRAISHVMSGTTFSTWLTSAISARFAALRISDLPAALKQWRKGCKKRKAVRELWQSQNRR